MIVCFRGRINFFTLLFFICFTSILTGCRKDGSTAGDDFVGEIVGFDAGSIDTTTLIAYTTQADSLINTGLYYYYLGQMNDPEFGKAKASPVVQFTLPVSGSAPDFSTVNIDSIVLQVKYVGASSYYGNAGTVQSLKVYELNEDLTTDSFYASNRPFVYASNAIGSWQGNFSSMGDSVKYTFAGASVTLPPHLRIKLDDPVFIQKFKDAKSAGALADQGSFQKYFKGLVIAPDNATQASGEGAIAYIHLRNGTDFANVITSVVLYYDSTQKVEFPIYSDDAVRANSISHETSITIPVQPLIGGSHNDINYVQGMSGLKTRILIPNLFDFVKDKNIAITRAQLIVTAASGHDVSPYSVPASLRLDESDSLGVNSYSTDLFLEGPTFYGGTYNSTSKQYAFNIVHHIQYLLKEYKQNNRNYNYGLNLYVVPNPASAGRVVLDTRPGKIKLKLSYTVIK